MKTDIIFNQLFLDFKKTHGDDHDIIFFEIIFALSKIVKNKEDFVNKRNEKIDFKINQYNKMIKKYFVKQMPLSHVTGFTNFCGLKLQISKKVLSPRDITQQMVSDFLECHKSESYLKVLDLCCGSGCIGITIKKYRPQFEVICVDKYWAPIFDTVNNAKLNKTSITVDTKDAIEYLNKINSIDILISNPPYINPKNFDNKKMFKYENKHALIAKDNGMYFYKQYFAWLAKHSFKECWLEVGYDLFDSIKQELSLYPNLISEIHEEKRYIVIKSKN